MLQDKWFEILKHILQLKLEGVNIPLDMDLAIEDFTKMLEEEPTVDEFNFK